MTGTVQLDQTVKKFSRMVRDDIKPSPKNQELLNNLCNELVVSQAKPLLEFVDVLIEKLMYPRFPSKSLMRLLLHHECAIIDDEENEASNADFSDVGEPLEYGIGDLGHPSLLELIVIRQKLVQLKAERKPTWKSTLFITTLLTKVQQVYILLVHLLKVLSDHIEVAAHAEFYRDIVVDSIVDFQRAFESFKALDIICQCLIKNVEKSGTSDEKVFFVDDYLLDHIKAFIHENVSWFEDIMLKSTAFKEYSLVENKCILDNKSTPNVEVFHQQRFEDFLVKRKSRLRVSTRKVF